MMPPGQYELLDFGEQEKLESFAGTIVRRETPSAPGNRSPIETWQAFDLRGKLTSDRTRWQGAPPDPWWFDAGKFQLSLKPTPTGQIGMFPEQLKNWQWIADGTLDFSQLKAINLFGYTGGSTLALAARGAQVVHVDSARSVVNWARSNADRSGLKEAPIRWIVEDAMTFVRREIKRGNNYDIVVADPPSFGRGPKNELWKIQRDLNDMMESLARLTGGRCQMILVSCHTPGIDHAVLQESAHQAFRLAGGQSQSFEMMIGSATGKQLPSGHCFRWSSPAPSSHRDT